MFRVTLKVDRSHGHSALEIFACRHLFIGARANEMQELDLLVQLCPTVGGEILDSLAASAPELLHRLTYGKLELTDQCVHVALRILVDHEGPHGPALHVQWMP